MKLTKQILASAKDARVTLIAGALSGALINIYPVVAIIALLILIVIVFILAFLDQNKSLKKIEIQDEEIKKLLKPDQQALLAAKNTDFNLLVVNTLVELVTHPNMNTGVKLSNIGWDPKNIDVEVLNIDFDGEEILDRAGGKMPFDPPNGTKYVLSNMPFVIEESPVLKLELIETDYFTIETIKRFFSDNPGVINEFGHVLPTENKIPNSLCLHYIVRTNEGKILCMKRMDGMTYHCGAFSITGEEQLSEIDLKSHYPIDALFKRALCEEIFHLRNTDALADAVSSLEEHFEYLRIFSLGTELPLYNATLFGIAQLKIDIDDLCKIMQERKIGVEMGGDEDREGAMYILTVDEAMLLLKDGAATVTGLFSGKDMHVFDNALHPTSRYRLFRLLRTIKRKAIVNR